MKTLLEQQKFENKSVTLLKKFSSKIGGFPQALVVKNPPAKAGDVTEVARYLGQEDPQEKGMATHSSILAWRIPWTEECYSP